MFEKPPLGIRVHKTLFEKLQRGIAKPLAIYTKREHILWEARCVQSVLSLWLVSGSMSEQQRSWW